MSSTFFIFTYKIFDLRNNFSFVVYCIAEAEKMQQN